MAKTSKKPEKEKLITRFYNGAEAYVEDLGLEVGVDRTIRLRFKTLDVGAQNNSEGTTPWVRFYVDGLEQFSAQLAAIVESAKKWTPGQPSDTSLGSNLNIVIRDEVGPSTLDEFEDVGKH